MPVSRAPVSGLTASAGKPARDGRPDIGMGRTPHMNNPPQADYEWHV